MIPKATTTFHLRENKSSPYEFEKWACGAVGAQGLFHNPGDRGADGGVDGIIPFYTSPSVPGSSKDDIEKTFAVVQVKGGKVTPDSVKALSTTVRESEGKWGTVPERGGLGTHPQAVAASG